MKNPIVSPYFQEDKYQGQDVVHRGIRIPLKKGSPDELLKAFSRNAQRTISANKDSGISFRGAETRDLAVLRRLWFNPDDPAFPDQIGAEFGIVAEYSGNVLGGALWVKQGANLFLHHLVAGDFGKSRGLPTSLIWESVKTYHDKYNALDIGVSYNPGRYNFFRNFAVETYPIILKKPFYVPVIRFSPFRSIENPDNSNVAEIPEDTTFLPRGSWALYAALKNLNLQKDDTVAIVKTFGSKFISKCVTDTIEKVCKWKLHTDVNFGEFRACLVVHEFGLPATQFEGFVLSCREGGVPIIEDCAWRVDKVWPWSNYAIFSAQKMFNINYGGVLSGVKLSDDYLWSIGCHDFVKRDEFLKQAVQDVGAERRVHNWKRYHQMVKDDGMESDDCYAYENVIEEQRWLPTVYIQRFESDEVADDIVARLEEFGIQAGRYWGEPLVYLPIHQNMTEAEVDYMFGVVRGYFNLCRDYVSKI